MEIGNQIKALRQRKGFTQEAMAQHFGITGETVDQHLRKIEQLEKKMMSKQGRGDTLF